MLPWLSVTRRDPNGEKIVASSTTRDFARRREDCRPRPVQCAVPQPYRTTKPVPTRAPDGAAAELDAACEAVGERAARAVRWADRACVAVAIATGLALLWGITREGAVSWGVGRLAAIVTMLVLIGTARSVVRHLVSARARHWLVFEAEARDLDLDRLRYRFTMRR